MKKQLNRNDVLNPERVLSNLLRDYTEGKLDDGRFLFRASVVAIDTVGGQFESNPANPKHSIKARIITDGYDSYTSDDDLTVFWPMFPFVSYPLKEREHVYVIFEDERKECGLWLTRIPEPADIDSKNFTAGITKYVQRPENQLTEDQAEKIVQDLSGDPTIIEVSPEFQIEENVSFTPRVGDHVVYGSNNTIIVLGRDRPGNKESGNLEDAGTVDIVVGRTTPEDMNQATDKSRIYISSKTDVDTNLSQTGDANVPDAQQIAAIAIKSDQIRVVARNGMKIVVEGGNLTIKASGNAVIDGENVFIGPSTSTEAAVLGNALKTILEGLIDQINTITVTTPAGPSTPPILNAAAFTALKAQLSTILSQTIKVKQ